ncbi:sulfotransferase family 2 domain-containing protein [Orrella daihaiensis]|uniref:Sulfotransferase family 2 domain-containing protein n=1 Tax=Orrella daihaiensis TaxID=2782176 RepID=A0ABY4AQX8_9BURK|nr:sulfotransferase family 2 domain-containing protein [Orrella daihaiensis]UOD51427.1 sulfotransferase family 2 domain-containing protein [Orrella daihaiensis]
MKEINKSSCIHPRLIFPASDFGLLNRCLLYYPSLNILFTYIPKNACSTLKYSLGVASKEISREQNPHMTEHKFRYADKRALYPSNSRPIICFRNPFERLVSAFLDKFARSVPEAEASLVLDKIRKIKNIGDNRSISFIDFVRFLKDQPSRQLDLHWRPQVDFIFFESYYEVFLVDTLTDQWNLHFPDIPLLDFIPHSTSKRYDCNEVSYDIPADELFKNYNSLGFPANSSFLNDEIVDIIQFRYFDDIQIYNGQSGKKVF